MDKQTASLLLALAHVSAAEMRCLYELDTYTDAYRKCVSIREHLRNQLPDLESKLFSSDLVMVLSHAVADTRSQYRNRNVGGAA